MDQIEARPLVEKAEEEIGVLVGRFQVHRLHDAHRSIINYVVDRHEKVILFLGVSPTTPNPDDPLEFTARKAMIEEEYGNSIQVIPIMDVRDDITWSQTLNRKIREVFPHGKARLYGGRDSFIQHYAGTHPTTELESDSKFNAGTAIRKQVAAGSRSSEDFRAGAIYATTNRFPISYSTVDIAPIQGEDIILARKPTETKFRLCGGFVDPTDLSLEDAALRELKEEMGINLVVDPSSVCYILSRRINDWRYPGRDKIMTHLFTVTVKWGHAVASDDICEVKKFNIADLKNKDLSIMIVEEHVPLVQAVIE